MALRNPVTLARDMPGSVRFERTINKDTVQNFLKSALLKFNDAKREANAGTTRQEAAYDAILMSALAVFAAQGYRVTSELGHHKIALEGLAAELRLSQTLVDEIDELREIRRMKYTGITDVRPADLAAALEMANRVLNETSTWLTTKHPDLLKR
jgi:hypothetical protein